MIDIKNWANYREKTLKAAKLRPRMYLGSEQYGHLVAIKEALALVWIAKVFRAPQKATVFLSPNQFVVLCETRPLLKELNRVLSWENKQILTDGWAEELNEYTGFGKTLGHGLRGWKHYYFSRTGPRIYYLDSLSLFSRRLCLAIKTDEGYWYQTFLHGFPQSEPSLIQKKSSVGLLLAVSLDSEWCKLPITDEEAKTVLSFHHNATHFRKVQMGSGHGGSNITTVVKTRDITFPNTIIQSHKEDDLVSETSVPSDEILKWL